MRAFLKDLPRSAFFLDYDGTLCPHQEIWEAKAYNPQYILSAMEHLSKRVGDVLWNTGRRVESLASVNESFLKFSGFFIQGSIVWDKQESHQIGLSLPAELEKELIEYFVDQKQYRLEIKKTGARLAPMQKTQKKFMKKYLETFPIKIGNDWEWRVGDRGIELLAKGFSKGSALSYAYDQALVDSSLIPVVAGDDYFDRPAMEYALHKGGYAVVVGESCGWITEIPHRSSQVIFFRDPGTFLQFLGSL
jgi:trehalose-6-phosphatase